jgi:hypothetical protein
VKSKNRDSYNKQNFENLVNYYKKELKLIIEGKSASKILSISERSTLTRSDILIKKGSGTRTQWTVSKQALDLLLSNINGKNINE